MGDVIRPTFGRPNSDEGGAEGGVDVELVHGFGEAAGYQVSLIRQETSPAGDVYKVVVGAVGSDEVLAVAITPATPAGQVDAGMVGTAILRTLELIEANATPGAG